MIVRSHVAEIVADEVYAGFGFESMLVRLEMNHASDARVGSRMLRLLLLMHFPQFA